MQPKINTGTASSLLVCHTHIDHITRGNAARTFRQSNTIRYEKTLSIYATPRPSRRHAYHTIHPLRSPSYLRQTYTPPHHRHTSVDQAASDTTNTCRKAGRPAASTAPAEPVPGCPVALIPLHLQISLQPLPQILAPASHVSSIPRCLGGLLRGTLEGVIRVARVRVWGPVGVCGPGGRCGLLRDGVGVGVGVGVGGAGGGAVTARRST
mmetsp:Transcript_25324/g.73097  ORF Transcript_25324/g.73097 Transcript_25324/m.73097 type:complete len:209 (-) Transcript_25324:1821-2447(-)